MVSVAYAAVLAWGGKVLPADTVRAAPYVDVAARVLRAAVLLVWALLALVGWWPVAATPASAGPLALWFVVNGVAPAAVATSLPHPAPWIPAGLMVTVAVCFAACGRALMSWYALETDIEERGHHVQQQRLQAGEDGKRRPTIEKGGSSGAFKTQTPRRSLLQCIRHGHHPRMQDSPLIRDVVIYHANMGEER